MSMKKIEAVPVQDWIKAIGLANGIDNIDYHITYNNIPKIDRKKAFDTAQALLRGGLYTSDDPIGKLHIGLLKKIKEIKVSDAIRTFLKDIRSANLKSIGIHIVDPIEGRISTIWVKPNQSEGKLDEAMLAKCELHSNAWNRIYRRLFSPSASLINAIESGVLPWQWSTVHLPGKIEPASCSLALFFNETGKLATELFKQIKRDEFLPNNPNAGEESHIEEVFQKTWKELESLAFTVRLKRIAERFRDSILDNQSNKTIFSEYLSSNSEYNISPPVIELATVDNPPSWPALLDSIEGIQSSILSQPEFCDTSGLWLHRIDFKNNSLDNSTSIYFIFGLTDTSDLSEKEAIKDSLSNLGKALDQFVDIPKVCSTSSLIPEVISKLQGSIESSSTASRNKEGLTRWLLAVEKISREAKHEGYPIKYNIGYGSLAYAQSHLHRYESAPKPLKMSNVPVEKISSYVKGFYSIFGNRDDRGLWFDEIGQYCGVFENPGLQFEKTVSDRISQHQDSVLFAKIEGNDFFEILSRNGNQISRVKNGTFIDMNKGDAKRREAIELLTREFNEKSHKSLFDNDFLLVSRWFIDELVEVLQLKTHGTSFIITFESNNTILQFPQNKKTNSWRSSIKKQTKTLVGDFSQLDAPLATWQQLKTEAEAAQNKSDTIRTAHPFKFLAELANLDGGLWLHLSNQGEKNGLTVQAAQQFIPLLKIKDGVRPFDLHMDTKLIENGASEKLPSSITEPVKELNELKALFSAINGQDITEATTDAKKYIGKLSFLQHSGTKTHSLWGLSLTALECCLCVVLSTDGNVYVFHDGREFT